MIGDRRYAVAEIDALRQIIRHKLVLGRYRLNVKVVIQGRQTDDLDRNVEDQVRTYMLAGLTADDLAASEEAEPGAGV